VLSPGVSYVEAIGCGSTEMAGHCQKCVYGYGRVYKIKPTVDVSHIPTDTEVVLSSHQLT
jgi:hypothetical protein